MTLHEIEDGIPGAGKTIGLHVSGQHAFGTIEQEKDVLSQGPRQLGCLTPLGPAQRQAHARNGQDQQ